MDEESIQEESFTPFLRAVECVDGLRLPLSEHGRVRDRKAFGSLLAVLAPFPLLVAARGKVLYAYHLPKGIPRAPGTCDSNSDDGGSVSDNSDRRQADPEPISSVELPSLILALYPANWTEADAKRASLTIVVEASSASKSVFVADVSTLLKSRVPRVQPLQFSEVLAKNRCVFVEPVYSSSGQNWDGKFLGVVLESGIAGVFDVFPGSSQASSTPREAYIHEPAVDTGGSSSASSKAISVAAYRESGRDGSNSSLIRAAVGLDRGAVILLSFDFTSRACQDSNAHPKRRIEVLGEVTEIESGWFPRYLSFLSDFALLVSYHDRSGDNQHLVWYLDKDGRPNESRSHLGELCYPSDAAGSSEEAGNNRGTSHASRGDVPALDVSSPRILTLKIPSWLVAVVGSSMSTDLEVLGLGANKAAFALSGNNDGHRDNAIGESNGDHESKWLNWKLDEGQSMTLPSDENYDDSMPVGIGLNLLNLDPVPASSDSEPPLNPMPRVVVLSSSGQIITYVLADDRPGAQCIMTDRAVPLTQLQDLKNDTESDTGDIMASANRNYPAVANGAEENTSTSSTGSPSAAETAIRSCPEMSAPFGTSARIGTPQACSARNLLANAGVDHDLKASCDFSKEENAGSQSFTQIRTTTASEGSTSESDFSDADGEGSFPERRSTEKASLSRKLFAQTRQGRSSKSSSAINGVDGNQFTSLSITDSVDESPREPRFSLQNYTSVENDSDSRLQKVLVPNFSDALTAAMKQDPLSQIHSIVMEMEEELKCVRQVLAEMRNLQGEAVKQTSETCNRLSSRISCLHKSLTILLHTHDSNNSEANMILRNTFSLAKQIEETSLLFHTMQQESKDGQFDSESAAMDETLRKKQADVERALAGVEDKLDMSARQTAFGERSLSVAYRGSVSLDPRSLSVPARAEILSILDMQGIRIKRVLALLETIEIQFMASRRLLRGHKGSEIGLSPARLQMLISTSSEKSSIRSRSKTRFARHEECSGSSLRSKRQPTRSSRMRDENTLSSCRIPSPGISQVLRELAMRGGRESITINPASTASRLLRDQDNDHASGSLSLYDDAVNSGARAETGAVPQCTLRDRETPDDNKIRMRETDTLAEKRRDDTNLVRNKSRSAQSVSSHPLRSTRIVDTSLSTSTSSVIESNSGAVANNIEQHRIEAQSRPFQLHDKPPVPAKTPGLSRRAKISTARPEASTDELRGNEQGEPGRNIIAKLRDDNDSAESVSESSSYAESTNSLLEGIASRAREGSSSLFFDGKHGPTQELLGNQAPKVEMKPPDIEANDSEKGASKNTSSSQRRLSETNKASPNLPRPFLSTKTEVARSRPFKGTISTPADEKKSGSPIPGGLPGNSIDTSSRVTEDTSKSAKYPSSSSGTKLRSTTFAGLPPEGSEFDEVAQSEVSFASDARLSSSSNVRKQEDKASNGSIPVASLPPEESENEETSQSNAFNLSQDSLQAESSSIIAKTNDLLSFTAHASSGLRASGEQPKMSAGHSSDNGKDKQSFSSSETLSASRNHSLGSANPTTAPGLVNSDTGDKSESLGGSMAGMLSISRSDASKSSNSSFGASAQGQEHLQTAKTTTTASSGGVFSASCDMSQSGASLFGVNGNSSGLNPSPFASSSPGQSWSFSSPSNSNAFAKSPFGDDAGSTLFGQSSSPNTALPSGFGAGTPSPFESGSGSGVFAQPAGFGSSSGVPSFGTPSKLGSSFPSASFGSSSSIGFGQNAAFGSPSTLGAGFANPSFASSPPLFGQQHGSNASAVAGFAALSSGGASSFGSGFGAQAQQSSPFGSMSTSFSSQFGGFAGSQSNLQTSNESYTSPSFTQRRG